MEAMHRFTTSPFTNAQGSTVCFVLFVNILPVFFFWVAFTSEVGTVLRIYVALTYRDFWRTSRRTNPIYEIVAAIVIPAGSNPGFLAPLAKILTTTRTLILSLINILKSNAWHSLLFLSLVWLPKFNYRIVQSMSHEFIDWCIDAKKLMHCCIDAKKLLFLLHCCYKITILCVKWTLDEENKWNSISLEQNYNNGFTKIPWENQTTFEYSISSYRINNVWLYAPG